MKDSCCIVEFGRMELLRLTLQCTSLLGQGIMNIGQQVLDQILTTIKIHFSGCNHLNIQLLLPPNMR